MNKVHIGIVGAGSFGTALAQVIAGNDAPRVTLWGRPSDGMEVLRDTRENRRYLPGVKLKPSIEPTDDFDALAECDVVLVVTPSGAVREVAARLAALGTRAPLVSCTKGLERGSDLRMSEVLQSVLPHNPVAVLSGPSHAEEMAGDVPTAVVLGCADAALAGRLQQAFSGRSFRVYTSADVVGIELGGALKNIVAIGAGVVDGLGFGDNSKAALLTRALGEITRVGVAFGGQAETFRGLSGLGDLMVTCFSRHSRNRAVGERLGRGETPEQIAASMVMVAEGVPTTRSAYEWARRHEMETPVIDAVYGLLYEQRSAGELLRDILARDPKPEAN